MADLWVTLLGRPGAGKTTVGHALSEGNYPGSETVHYISGSRLLDDYVGSRRDGWRKVKKEKEEGRTAPPDLTHRLLGEHVASLEGSGVVLLDGFPKTYDEIAMTEATIPGGAIDLAVLFDCPSDECIARVQRRLACDSCGAVTNTGDDAAVSAPCDRPGCDGSLIRRADGDVSLRIREQGHESAVVLAKHFRERGRLVEVNALAEREVVIAEVALAIEEKNRVTSTQNPG